MTPVGIQVEEKQCLKKGVKYISLYGGLGYFTAAKRYMLGLIRSGMPLTWTPMVPGNSLGMNLHPLSGTAAGDPDLDFYCNRPLEYDTVIVHTPPDFYPLWRKEERGKRVIGYTVWETDQLPPHWPALLNTLDQLLVPCSWNKDVFKRCNVDVPIAVIPHILDAERPATGETTFNVEPGIFVFYTIGTWTARKGIQQTIQCYLDTFTARDPTLLLIKTTKTFYRQGVLTGLMRSPTVKRPYHFLRRLLNIQNHFTSRVDTTVPLQKMLGKYDKPARIKLITNEVSEDTIRQLHQRGDCFISLCHSEGWGLGAFDAAAMGKPVIITAYGGQMDYLDPDLAYLVDYDLVPVRNDEDPNNFRKEQKWAEPKIPAASQLMRLVYENPSAARQKAGILRTRIHERFSEEAVGKQLMSVLEKN